MTRSRGRSSDLDEHIRPKKREGSLRNRLLAVVAVASLGSVLLTGSLLASFYSLSARREALSDLSRQAVALAEEVARIVRLGDESRPANPAPARRIPLRAVLSSGKLDYVGVWYGDRFSPPKEMAGSGEAGPSARGAEEIFTRIEGSRSGPTEGIPRPVSGEMETESGKRVLFAAQVVQGSGGRLVVITARRLALPSLRVLVRLVVASLLGLGVSVGLAWWLSKRILTPLKEMEMAALSIAKGDYTARVRPPRDRELASLAESMNHMAEKVRTTREREQGLLMTISHDLRTPLTSIRAYAEGLADGTIEGQEAVTRAAGVIAAEAGRLSRLVDDLFDAARIGSGELRLDFRQIDLAELVEDVVSVFSSRAEKARVRLVTRCEKEAIVTTDGDRMAQVVSNLVDNALKNTPFGGSVEVGVEDLNKRSDTPAFSGSETVGATTSEASENRAVSTGESRVGRARYRLYVTDTGRGIPPEHLERVFEPGFSYDRLSGGGSGSGLGLAIVRSIVSALGCYLAAESEEGKGTTISIYIP